jgi:hypothetical protein
MRWVAILLLTGCLPDLGLYTIVRAGEDGGVLPGTDGGAPIVNPIDLGEPCPDPHLLIGTVSGSGQGARVMRVDPATRQLCRATEHLERLRAYGDRVSDVEWHRDTGELLGLYDAVLALDEQGFPAWRFEPFSDGYFRGDWVAAFGSPLRIAVAYSEGSSSLSHMALLDADGELVNYELEPPFFAFAIAAAPDGSNRLLMPSRAGDELDMYSVNDGSTTFPEASAIALYTVTRDMYDTYGNREHVSTDLATQRVVVARTTGIEHWSMGDPAPTTAVECPSLCERFQAAAIDPADDRGAFAICHGASDTHLVRVSPSGCTMVIDGTSLGSHSLTDVTLVRDAL